MRLAALAWSARPLVLHLPIPPILRPMSRDATTDFYTITQQASTHEYIPGLSTPIWGYNGITPGPTILVRKGRKVTITHVMHCHNASHEDHDMMTRFDVI